MRNLVVSVCLCCFSAVPVAAAPADADQFWPQWRGPQATGVAPHGTPPLEWSETRNIRWKVEIPGRGSTTPIVWGDRVFVVTAVPSGEPVEPRQRESSRRAIGKGRNLPNHKHSRFSRSAVKMEKSCGRG